jgi:hypothetical protein
VLELEDTDNLLSDSAYRFARDVVDLYFWRREARLGRRLWALLVLGGVTVLALLRTVRQTANAYPYFPPAQPRVAHFSSCPPFPKDSNILSPTGTVVSIIILLHRIHTLSAEK